MTFETGLAIGLIIALIGLMFQWKINARQRKINAKQAETNNTIFGLLNTHTEIIGSTVDDLHTTAQNIHLMLEGQDERRQTEVLRARLTELESTEGRLRKKRRP